MNGKEILTTIRRRETIALIALPGIPMVVGVVALAVGLGFENPTLTRLGVGLIGVGATPEAVVAWNIFNLGNPRPVPQEKPPAES